MEHQTCSTYKKNLEREKGTTLFVTCIASLNKTSKNNQAPARTSGIKSKRGNHHLCVLGT